MSIRVNVEDITELHKYRNHYANNTTRIIGILQNELLR